MEMLGRYIGLNGKRCANQSHKGVWALRTSPGLMMLSWPNTLGDYCMIITHYFIESSRHDFSRIVVLWKPRNQVTLRLLEGVSLGVEM